MPYSSFLRGPGAVLPALERGDVQLDRRDAEALVMTRAGRYRAALRGTSLASAMLRGLAKNDAGLAARLLAEQLPWLAWMPRAEQQDCLSEILTHLAAGAETGTFEPFARPSPNGSTPLKSGRTQNWQGACLPSFSATAKPSRGPRPGASSTPGSGDFAAQALDGAGSGL